MGLETLTGTVYLDSLNSSNPTATDVRSEGDDHIRGIKNTLLNTFPSLTGAVNATQAELNALASQIGGFLLQGVQDAGGTVDALTATYSPAITLTDKVTVIVRAAGANATTTPTFSPNSLTAHTITKNGNQALLAGDIYGAGHVLILQYNSSNTVWELLNPARTEVDQTGYIRGRQVYIQTDGTGTSYGSVTSLVTAATWTSIGPTGSGATNIWSALDIMPSTATAVILRGKVSGTNSVAAVESVILSARKTGSSVTYTDAVICAATGEFAASHTETMYGQDVIIPIDSSNRFDLYWYSSVDTSQSAALYFVGWLDDY